MSATIHQRHPAPTACSVVAHPIGRGTLLEVSGEVDPATVPLLRAVIHDTVAQRPGRVHVDLSRVTFFDCSGLAVLIALRNRALQEGTAPLGVTASRQVRRLLDLAGVSELFDLYYPAPDGAEGDLRTTITKPAARCAR